MTTNHEPFTIHFGPSGRRANQDHPLSILEAAREAGVEIAALCGGLGSCGRCRVKVEGDGVSPLSQKERELLSADEIAGGYRLACRAIVDDDVSVYVPDVSRPRAQQLQLSGRERPVAPSPAVRKMLVDLSPPTLADPRSDLDRIDEALRLSEGTMIEGIDVALLGHIGPALREGGWRATLTLDGSELIHVEPGDTTERLHGVAVDLGSTKIAAYLVDLTAGETLEAQGTMNPQIAYGEDIATRLSYAVEHDDGASQLQRLVVDAIADLIHTLCEENDLSPDEVLEIVVVGNTAMHHLFLALSTAPLTASPFVPIATRPLRVKARELGLPAAPGACVTCPSPVAGFVGSDHVAMVLASRLAEKPGTFLGIDIGTNTEISLKRDDAITAVSCASGPAFEGAAICWGMKAAPGAIERVWIEPGTREIHLSTIGDAEPVGICGSGILDCVAGMVGAGLMNARGHIRRDASGVRIGESGLPAFVLAETPAGRTITVTQSDVERIQMAKGAIRSGIEVLLDAADVTSSDLDGVILAGAFGTFIDPLSAIEIGMLPPVPPERIAQIGNAAGAGAKEILISTERRRKAEEVARQIEYLELTVYPNYSRFFARALRF